MRRRFQIFTLTCSVVILLTIMSKWSSPPIYTEMTQSFLSTSSPIRDDLTQTKPKINRIRTDLPKYIHLDLKGAPPKANAFFTNFFQFIDKIQMGVKGFLIEYEDMLPLEGRLANVSV